MEGLGIAFTANATDTPQPFDRFDRTEPTSLLVDFELSIVI
jgi:hypothetical protein